MALQRLKQEFGITGKNLVTFMSDSVAVGLDDDSVFTALQRLEQEFGITGKNPDTYMSNSVAVRLDDDSFFMALLLLAQVLGITDKNLVKFLSNSVAVRLDKYSFFMAPRGLHRSSASQARTRSSTGIIPLRPDWTTTASSRRSNCWAGVRHRSHEPGHVHE